MADVITKSQLVAMIDLIPMHPSRWPAWARASLEAPSLDSNKRYNLFFWLVYNGAEPWLAADVVFTSTIDLVFDAKVLASGKCANASAYKLRTTYSGANLAHKDQLVTLWNSGAMYAHASTQVPRKLVYNVLTHSVEPIPTIDVPWAPEADLCPQNMKQAVQDLFAKMTEFRVSFEGYSRRDGVSPDFIIFSNRPIDVDELVLRTGPKKFGPHPLEQADAIIQWIVNHNPAMMSLLSADSWSGLDRLKTTLVDLPILFSSPAIFGPAGVPLEEYARVLALGRTDPVAFQEWFDKQRDDWQDAFLEVNRRQIAADEAVALESNPAAAVPESSLTELLRNPNVAGTPIDVTDDLSEVVDLTPHPPVKRPAEHLNPPVPKGKRARKA